MTKEELNDLLDRYESGECTPQERALLERWISNRVQNNSWGWADHTERELVKASMKSHVERQLFVPKRTTFTLRRLAVAASILVCCAVATWLYLARQVTDQDGNFFTEHATQPGNKTAQLTLADGRTIWLGDAEARLIYDENGITIKKLANGELQYETENISPGEVGVIPDNIISVPHGGQFQLELPDGTKVWLNSATRLVYPMAFVGDSRNVTLSGEAYFEVAKNEHQPFKVLADNTEIAVTGTMFNVAAYPDEGRVVTTLLEGGVEVFRGANMATLRPGDEAVTTPGNNDIQTKQVDGDNAVAWLHGDFLFENQDIETIMKNVARWYNVEVVFTGPPYSKTFGGTYSRDKGLEELLTHLESLSGIRFNYAEGRVTVMR